MNIYRRIATFAICCIAFAAASFSTAVRSFAADTLAGYLNHNRVLLVFAPSSKSPAYLRQQGLIAAAPAAQFTDRDLRVIRCTAPTHPAPQEAALRSRYHVAPLAFRVLLIGKDGHTAYTSAQPIAPAELFVTIDRMPMRRDEMRRKGEL